MTRAEHLEWCKVRAREYLDRGDVRNAIMSMLSDLGRHPETEATGRFSMMGLSAMQSGNVDEARRFIEGFN